MLCYVAGDNECIVLKQAITSAIDKLPNTAHYISSAKWLYIIICKHVRYDGNGVKIRFTLHTEQSTVASIATQTNGNRRCSSLSMCRCSGDVPYITADDFETNLRELLEEVHSKIPRVFVNLVEIFNMSMVRSNIYDDTVAMQSIYKIYEKSKTLPHCQDIHRIFAIECLCVFLDNDTR